MALPMTNLSIFLDTNRPNININRLTEERFLQGNTDKTFKIGFLKNGESVTITDNTKPTITLVFYNGNSIYKKYLISPTNVDGSPNTKYTIPPITDNILTIPFSSDIAFSDHAGRVDLIIKIDDNGSYYTYSCTYTVDVNEAYNPVGIIDNLPSIDNFNNQVSKLNSDVAGIKTDIANTNTEVAKKASKTELAAVSSDLATTKQNVQSNTQTLTTKADTNLSNVGTFAAAPEGSILYKKDGQLKSANLVVDDVGKIIETDYKLKTAPNTLMLGSNIEIHENGGFIENETKTLGKKYLLLDYENDPLTGTKKPIYYERGPLIQKYEINSIATTRMDNVSTFNIGTPSSNRQVQAIYFNFATVVNNLKFKITVNNKDVGYFPSESAWKGSEQGINLVTGVQRIPLKPFWTSLTSYSIVLTFRADTPINLMGDGIKPYYAVDENPITLKNIALEEEITSLTETGATIRNKLQALQGDERLDAASIKNLPHDDLSNLALKDLTNVDNDTFKKKGYDAGLLQKDLADIDLKKLEEKGHDSGLISSIKMGQTHGDYREGDIKEIYVHNNLDLTFDDSRETVAVSIADVYASKDISNVDTGDMDKAIRLTNAYKEIANRKPEHEGVIARHIEEQGAIDFSTISEKLIHAVYQITSEQEVITQTLPPLSDDKTIIIEVLMSSGISSYSHLTLTPAAGEQINGASTPLTLTEKGIQGILIPEASNSWIWIPYPIMNAPGIAVNDQKSNFFLGQNALAFGAGFTATQDPDNNERVKIDYSGSSSGSNEMTFVDGLSGGEFNSNKIQSLDKSIRISNLKGVADISRGNSEHNEGVHVCLGNDELLNSKFGKAKMYFSDTRVKGGMFVYPDTNTKSFIMQDVDPQDDPNVSGGTTFIVALYYEPNPDEKNILTQDGQIILELVDDNDIPVSDTEGNPMGAVIDYKANDKIKPELYIGECKISAFTRVHLKIGLNFTNEEIVSVGANTQLCIQSITKEESSGLALLSFMAFTGYNINFDIKYYGYNSLNMAQFLTFDVPEAGTGIEQMQFGNNTYLDFKANAKLSISNNHLVIKDDGITPPIWSIIKMYDKLDSHSISGKNYKVTAVVTDKDNAYRVGLLEYTGTTKPAPIPSVLRYQNENPIFTDGWVQRDSMFISEDAVTGDHTQSKTFVIPNDPKSLAIIMYPQSSIPSTLMLKDLEGDITPWFNRTIITDNSHISERYLQSKDGVYRGIVKTPSGDLAYRYTVNSTDTKIPVGVISGDDNNIVNDNSWTEAGSIDPNKVQGDLKFLVDGKVTISYTARCFNEQNTLNQIQFWLSKNVGGSFTEVPNSKTASTIEANRTQPKMVNSFKFSFDVKANETYRMFAKSDKDDGFYLQSNLDGVPLFRLDIEFDEFTTSEKDIFDKTNEIKFMENGQEVYNKLLEYDVTTGKMKVIDK